MPYTASICAVEDEDLRDKMQVGVRGLKDQCSFALLLTQHHFPSGLVKKMPLLLSSVSARFSVSH